MVAGTFDVPLFGNPQTIYPNSYIISKTLIKTPSVGKKFKVKKLLSYTLKYY